MGLQQMGLKERNAKGAASWQGPVSLGGESNPSHRQHVSPGDCAVVLAVTWARVRCFQTCAAQSELAGLC